MTADHENPDGVSPDHGSVETYFDAVASCSASAPSWRAWISSHSAELTQRFGRSTYLGLKFDPQGALPPLLSSLGISFDPAALDVHLRAASRGMPWSALPRDSLGVRELIRDGRLSESREVIRAHVRFLAARAEAEEQLEDGESPARALCEVVWDALVSLEYVDRDPALYQEALLALDCVAELQTLHDMVDEPVRDARRVHSRLREELGSEPDMARVARWARELNGGAG